jgi:hypothetical protein
MLRWIEGALEKQRARKTIKTLLIVFFVALVFSIFSKIIDHFPNTGLYKYVSLLNKVDTLFAIIVGILTVIGLMLAFYAIKGFLKG